MLCDSWMQCCRSCFEFVMCLVVGFSVFGCFLFLCNPSSNVNDTTNIFHGFLAFWGFSAFHRYSAFHGFLAFQRFSSLFIKMQDDNAVSGYPKTGHLYSWKCNTTVLVQDIQKLIIFVHLNAMLQCWFRISKKWSSLFFFCILSSAAQGSELPVLV